MALKAKFQAFPAKVNAGIRSQVLKWLGFPPVPTACDVICPLCKQEFKKVALPATSMHASMRCFCGAELDISPAADWRVRVRV